MHGIRVRRYFNEINEMARHALSGRCRATSSKADPTSAFKQLHSDKTRLEGTQKMGYKVVERATAFGNLRRPEVGKMTEWQHQGTGRIKGTKRKIT